MNLNQPAQAPTATTDGFYVFEIRIPADKPFVTATKALAESAERHNGTVKLQRIES